MTRNAACQPRHCTSSPPTIGPSAIPAPITAVQTPKASARSRGSVNTTRRIDRVEGMIAAPPTPSSARAAMTSHGAVATVASSDAAANTANPTISSRLRPQRSPSAPAVISSPDSASA